MQWPFSKQTTSYALVGDRSRALLAAKNPSPTGTTAATPLGWSDSPLSETKSVHQVMANIANPKGDVAISLPLDQFELLSIAVNKVPREVVDKILPYHIAKVLDEPLEHFIYDWQIAKERKDSLQLNVFLFPAKMFQELRSTLGHYKLNPTTLEPDVFSACAFLESRHLLQADEATMIALLWPKSISIAIYDNENLILTRTVQLRKPEHAAVTLEHHESGAELDLAAEIPQEPAATEPSQPESFFEPHSDDLLANFLIETKEEDGENIGAEFTAPAEDDQDFFNTLPYEGPQAPEAGQNWPAYINQVSLELMRTRDYFNSVVKGNQVKTAFVGGGEDSWKTLSAELENSLDIQVKPLLDPETATLGDPLFEAISIGVLS